MCFTVLMRLNKIFNTVNNKECRRGQLQGAGLPAMGAQLCLGAGCAKVEAPGHPGHPPPLATQLLKTSKAVSC